MKKKYFYFVLLGIMLLVLVGCPLPIVAPIAPTDLSAQALSSSEIKLTWQDNSSDETGFKIERRKGDENWKEIDEVGSNKETYTDLDVDAEARYTYRVKAYNAGGDSTYTDPVIIETMAGPTELDVKSLSSTEVELTWKDNTSKEEGYLIERKIGTGNWSQIGEKGINIVTYKDQNLQPETQYTYRVRAYNEYGNSNYSNELAVTTKEEGKVPSAPTNLKGEALSSSEIKLTWTDNSTNEEGFKIERKDGETGSFSQITTVVVDTTQYTDETVSSEVEYTYRIKAYNDDGDSDYSNEETVITMAKPTDLSGEALSSSKIKLTWQDNSNYETGFKIERKEGEAGSFSEITTVLAGTTQYTDETVNPEIKYTYRVKAYNDDGGSDYSDEKIVITMNAPSNLSAEALSSSEIRLTWQDNSTNETGFKIERKSASTGWVEITKVGANIREYTNEDLTRNTEYTYRVRAYNDYGNSDYSSEKVIKTLPEDETTTPAAPSDLRGEALSSTMIKLTWQDNSNYETGFKIERKTKDTDWAVIKTKEEADVEEYTDEGLSPNTTYYYRVKVYNSVGDSSYSNEVDVTTPDVAPNAPSNLSAEVLSSTEIKLRWQDNSTNETGFKIERKTKDTDWAVIETIEEADVEEYTDSSNIQTETEYTYRVKAYNEHGDSDYSDEKIVITMAKPTDLNAEASSSTTIELTWKDNSNYETGFKIERKSASTGWEEIQKIEEANVDEYTDTGLTRNTEYTYRVRAYNDYGNSDYSNEKAVKTLPEDATTTPLAPSDLGAEALSSKTIKLTWADNSNYEEGFKIERKTKDTDWALIGTIEEADVEEYTDGTAQPETEYTYRVKAYNGHGDSDYSNEERVITMNAPTDLSAEVLSSTMIKLEWEDNSDYEDGFKIERKTKDTDWTLITIIGGPNVEEHTVSYIQTETEYTYRIKAYNDDGDSDYSNEETVITINAPSDLSGEALSSSEIKLTWTDNSNYETGFKIERKTETIDWAVIETIEEANVEEYKDEGLSPNSTYYYRVKAYNSVGDSSYSNEIDVTTLLSSTISDLNDLSESDSLYILKIFIDGDINDLMSDLEAYITDIPFIDLEELDNIFNIISELEAYYQGLLGVYDDYPDTIFDKLQDMMDSSEDLIGDKDLHVQIVGQAKDDIMNALGGTEEPETLVVDYRDLLNMRIQVWGLLSLYEAEDTLQPYFDVVDSIDPDDPLKYFLLDDSYGAISGFINKYIGEISNELWETEDFWDDLDSLVTELAGITGESDVLTTDDIFKGDVLSIGGLNFIIEKGKFILESFNDLYYFEEEKTDEYGWTDDDAISLYEYPYFASGEIDAYIKHTEFMDEPIILEDLISELLPEELSALIDLIDIVEELKLGNIDLLQEPSWIELFEELNSVLPNGVLELTAKIETPVTIEGSVDATVSIDVSIDLDFGELSDGTLDLMSNNLGMNPAMINGLIEQGIWEILATGNITQAQASAIYDIILSNLTFYDLDTNILTIEIDDSIIAEVIIYIEWE